MYYTSKHPANAAYYINSYDYQMAGSYTYTSSIPTDYFTLRKSSDNSYITSGQSPLTLDYSQDYGNIEIHVSSDAICNTSYDQRTVTVSGVCHCQNIFPFPDFITDIQCGPTIIWKFTMGKRIQCYNRIY
ncbi:MAG: hypothetical protein IPO92_20125 [Saprospiraceae bacterium]|nr:hypothetical protein [Saprospiraceae bacterium]